KKIIPIPEINSLNPKLAILLAKKGMLINIIHVKISLSIILSIFFKIEYFSLFIIFFLIFHFLYMKIYLLCYFFLNQLYFYCLYTYLFHHGILFPYSLFFLSIFLIFHQNYYLYFPYHILHN